MPLGKYKTFDACVVAQKSRGLNDDEARRYCGYIQAHIEGTKEKHQAYGVDEGESEDVAKE